ncbi:hypothetical protein DUNSADRAFT_15503 [Dunaliella salina]|uniref:EF-hand domain-containing protein n=1 Tax=Dunaliella salina TaxID=3046 RepID=A0ABQ7H1R4_DUNSA|nr:hypothetical protein DUNSADRAFT_15503 [Dunaliella salina]|eukprot:KAF5840794.1 hypothetical protein DUNSADRAFT_15503 [Dunaliella salina]
MPLSSSPTLQRRFAEPAFAAQPTAVATSAPHTGQGGSKSQDLQPGSTPALPPLHLNGGPPAPIDSSNPVAHSMPGPEGFLMQHGSEQQGWRERGERESFMNEGTGYQDHYHHSLQQQQQHQQHQQHQLQHQHQRYQQQQQQQQGTFTATPSTRSSLPHTPKPLAWQPPWHQPFQPLGAWQSLSSSPRQRPHTQASPSRQVQTPVVNTLAVGDPRTQMPRVNQARNRLERFTPTRGMMLSVFEELDRFGENKLTASTLEDAAVRVGLNAEQIRRFYSMLDPQNRGYITMRDWGNATLNNQATRGLHGKMMDAREVQSVALAMQIALSRLQMKSMGRSVAHARLFNIFEFMDTDRNGGLSLQEIRDAFSAIGINVTDQVLQDIMKKFDKDQNGTIDYREFIKGLYPIMSQGCRVFD